MADILATILETKQQEVEVLLSQFSLEQLKQKALKADAPRRFAAAMKAKIEQKRPAFIAEIKKASPSKGLIRADFSPTELAKAYAQNGATCLSVLTDRQYFQGANEFLVAAREACSLPVLRKDFIIDEAQVYEARMLGADAILLIVAALTDEQLHALEALAISLGMDVLVEIHDEGELERSLDLKTTLIGINNRNLKTFHVDLEVSVRLKKMLPQNRLVVCESGIDSKEDIEEMMQNNIYGFLVGETFMREKQVGPKLKIWSEISF